MRNQCTATVAVTTGRCSDAHIRATPRRFSSSEPNDALWCHSDGHDIKITCMSDSKDEEIANNMCYKVNKKELHDPSHGL